MSTGLGFWFGGKWWRTQDFMKMKHWGSKGPYTGKPQLCFLQKEAAEGAAEHGWQVGGHCQGE